MERSFRLLSIIFFILFLNSCSKKEKPVKLNSEKIKGFELEKRESGKLIWKVKGESAEFLNPFINIKKPEIVFYTKYKNKIFIKSNFAKINKKTEEIELTGNVFLKDLKNKVEVYLEDLKWDPKKKAFTSNGSVREIVKETVITGKGLFADEKLSNIEIKENVKIEKK